MAASSVARSLQTWRKPPATLLSTTRVPQTSPRCPSIPSCPWLLSSPVSQVGESSTWWLLLSSGPNNRRKSISRVTSQPCYPGGDIRMVKTLDAPTQPWRCCPRTFTVFQLQGHLLPHFPNSPKPRPIIVIVVSPNLPGHLPALFRELGQLRQRLLSSPAIQNLGSFPLTLLYSKSSRLPSSPCPGGNYRKVAVPSTSGSHNLRMSPPEI